jgi:hypothetical protein
VLLGIVSKAHTTILDPVEQTKYAGHRLRVRLGAMFWLHYPRLIRGRGRAWTSTNHGSSLRGASIGVTATRYSAERRSGARLPPILGPLTEFLAGRLEDKPDPLPRWLRPLIHDIEPEKLALMVLAPLLNGIDRKWDAQRPDYVQALFKLAVGKELGDRLALERPDRELDWGPRQRIHAGHWLMKCAMVLDCFTCDEDGLLTFANWQKRNVDQLREDILRRSAVLLPHTTPPPDWTGPIAKYDARLQAPFVRDWRRETQQAVKEAFDNGSIAEHARGVNALQRVPLRIDTRILALVEKFGAKVLNEGIKDDKKAHANRRIIRNDVSHAKYFGDDALWLTYNCDKRGRVYGIPHLNYSREDHVRALFKFDNGLPLGRYDVRWLEIHCANCGGLDFIDKMQFQARVGWAQ